MDTATSDLLAQTYRCGENSALWPDVLDRFRIMIGVRSAVVQRVQRGGDRMTTQWCGVDAQTIRSGATAPMPDAHNPRMSTQHSPPMPDVAFFRDEENLDSRDPDVKRMRKRLGAAGLHSFLGARVEMENGQTVLLALHGNADKRWAFEGETLRTVAQFMPHVRQVFAMSERSALLNEREAVLLEVVGRLNCGLVLLGADGVTLRCNDAVEHMVADHGELALADGQLVGRTPHDYQRLRALLGEVARGRNAGAAFGKCADLIHISGIALPDGSGQARAALLLFRAGAERTNVSPPLLGQLFGLTRAEASLAAAICRGETISGYAADKGISVFTARFQLKQVLAKTGALRQSDLVGLICTSRAASIAQTAGIQAQSPA